MNGKTLLRNGVLVTLEPLKLEKRDLLIEEGRVTARDRNLNAPAGCEVIDCRGRYIFPGFVNAQSHLFLSQTLGMPLARPDADEQAQARRRLEEALSPETIITAAFSGALDAVSLGTTTIIDAHSSPRQITSSLDLIRDTVLTVGMRLVSSYEIDTGLDRDARLNGLRESQRFCVENKSDKTTGLFGLRDFISADDDFLNEVAREVAQTRSGLHLAIDSSAEAVAAHQAKHGCSAVERLQRANLLGPRTILAHAAFTSAADLEIARSTQTWLVHCPTADAIAGRAAAPFERFGDFSAIGTAGCRSNIFAEARAAYLQARARGADVRPEDVIRMIVGAQQLASDLLGIELGSTNRDAGADFVIMNYHPRTPMTPETLAEHLLFGMGPEHIEQVMIDGNIVYRNGAFPEIDTRRLAPLMRKGAESLWSALSAEDETSEQRTAS